MKLLRQWVSGARQGLTMAPEQVYPEGVTCFLPPPPLPGSPQGGESLLTQGGLSKCPPPATELRARREEREPRSRQGNIGLRRKGSWERSGLSHSLCR